EPPRGGGDPRHEPLPAERRCRARAASQVQRERAGAGPRGRHGEPHRADRAAREPERRGEGGDGSRRSHREPRQAVRQRLGGDRRRPRRHGVPRRQPGGNFVFRAALDGSGRLTLGLPVVRYQTGNIPNGVAVTQDGKRAYVNNEVNLSVTAIDLEANRVIERDVPIGTPPTPGSFAHAVLVGKLTFFTALGTPNDGLLDMPVRGIEPLKFRGKAADNAWSSCGSCHPDGLTDNVTWSFPDGPRQTLPLDAFFAKDNPVDQRISNWSAVRG